MNYNIKEVGYGTAAYEDTLKLRDTVLRKPLGMVFTPEQLAGENEQVHIACYSSEGLLLGCLVLVLNKEMEKMKMRQMAVMKNQRRQGIGKKLVLFAEEYGRANNFKLMYFHARKTAIPFYEKLNYTIIGEEFEEVSIPHYKMEKHLLV